VRTILLFDYKKYKLSSTELTVGQCYSDGCVPIFLTIVTKEAPNAKCATGQCLILYKMEKECRRREVQKRKQCKAKKNDPTVTSGLVSVITATSRCLRSQTMPIILIDM
jgi:hypothetical protein